MQEVRQKKNVPSLHFLSESSSLPIHEEVIYLHPQKSLSSLSLSFFHFQGSSFRLPRVLFFLFSLFLPLPPQARGIILPSSSSSSIDSQLRRRRRHPGSNPLSHRGEHLSGLPDKWTLLPLFQSPATVMDYRFENACYRKK